MIDEYFDRLVINNYQEVEEFLVEVHQFNVEPHDYDKRCRAMTELLSYPRSNTKYNKNQAINLANFSRSMDS